MNTKDSQLIRQHTKLYSRFNHLDTLPGDHKRKPRFIPGVTTVPYAGRVFEEEEVCAAVESALAFWLTLGSEGTAMESELAHILGVKHSILVNSGSSANLVALSALTSHKLPAEKRIMPGDEIITVAAGFPTTVSPIIQIGAVPVFIDADPVTGNVDPRLIDFAFTPGKTKAVILAHSLGNPFDLAYLISFCNKHDLWLIEDNCDALGSTYSLPVVTAAGLGLKHLLDLARDGHPTVTIVDGILTAPTGSFGDLSTQSFYPAHHITMGEGGAVNIIRRASLKSIVESMRDWGRDCWCATGKDDTCGRRFSWHLGELPEGYDHKYIYSHLGYNLKPLDIQAAIGRIQLRRLPAFGAARKANWRFLRRGLGDLDEFLEFSLPAHAVNSDGAGTVWNPGGFSSDPSWFGFSITVRETAPFTRNELAGHLDEMKIGNRMPFGGNLTRQPAFVHLKRSRPDAFRVCGSLDGADRIMNQSLFIGTYPGLSPDMLTYMVETIRNFVRIRSSHLATL